MGERERQEHALVYVCACVSVPVPVSQFHSLCDVRSLIALERVPPTSHLVIKQK